MRQLLSARVSPDDVVVRDRVLPSTSKDKCARGCIDRSRSVCNQAIELDQPEQPYAYEHLDEGATPAITEGN
jgi:hypothetical protein